MMARDDDFPSNDERYYFRGLESQLPKARMERQQRTKKAVSAILKLQKAASSSSSSSSETSADDNHERLGRLRDHWLDTVYADKYSAPSAEDAWMAALWDQTAAWEALGNFIVGAEDGTVDVDETIDA